MDATPAASVADREAFRHAIGHFASGVTVLTTHVDGEDFGATASAMTSLSLDPPMLLVCLNTRSSTQEAIHRSGVLGVNILAEHQGQLAERFASRHGGKFDGLDLVRGVDHVPLLAESLAYCECRVAESVLAGTHRVFLSTVTRAVAREGSPLTYFRGSFGRFEVEQDRLVYGELRAKILSRSISLEDSLDVAALAKEFDTLPSTVYHAVTKLVSDGLLTRDAGRGYVIKPVTLETADQAFDARCAIELGVAATTVGRVSAEALAELRRLMIASEPLLARERVVDVEEFARRSGAFHHAIVAMSGNPTLIDSYERLGIAGLTMSLMREDSATGADIRDDHRELVEAYERGDLATVMLVIVRHNENVKATNRRAIEAAGGQL